MLIVLASPHINWYELQDEDTVARWAAAASAIPRTKEVGQAVVDALLRIASVDSLRLHIPVDIWAWLETQPSLPPKCLGRSEGARKDVARHVRTLEDVEILKSYFLLVWSEWNLIHDMDLTEMTTSIREDFSGTGMRLHREDLVKRLDHVLGQLDRGPGYLFQHNRRIGPSYVRQAKGCYKELKRVLLEVDGEEANIPTRTPSSLNLFGLLMLVDAHRIPLDLHAQSVSPMSIISHLTNVPFPATSFVT